MIRYLSIGFRQFGLYPLVSMPRVNWEFYAVVQGRCAPVIDKQAKRQLASHTLWIFPPGSNHGWTGIGAQRAHITCFHFDMVPPQLEAVVKPGSHLEISLGKKECKRLVALARELQPEFERRNGLSSLMFRSAVIELTLLALRRLPSQTTIRPESEAERTVDAARQWFAERAHLNPSIGAVARGMNVSISTLRRRFHLARQGSPAHVFEEIRIELAMRLMSSTDYKLDVIASQCGYSCTSDFCRAFKAFMGITPNAWRKSKPASTEDAIGFGVRDFVSNPAGAEFVEVPLEGTA